LTNPVVAGTVKGKVSSDLISLAIKHDKRSATFTGRRVGNAYIGDLRLAIPPARETLTNVSLVLDGVYVASGSASFRGAARKQSSRRMPLCNRWKSFPWWPAAPNRLTARFASMDFRQKSVSARLFDPTTEAAQFPRPPLRIIRAISSFPPFSPRSRPPTVPVEQ
jgi:hypothetical protein